MFTKITEERAFDGILAQIIENIRRGELKPGDTLPAERVMAESLGVSRPAVREVLRALELMGIVTTVRGGANYITENMDQWLSAPLALLFQLNNSHVQQVQELRSALEQEASCSRELYGEGCIRSAFHPGTAGELRGRESSCRS